MADVEKDTPVEPDALFRIASLSKPITAAACLVLVEKGRLELDAKVVKVLDDVEPLPGESMDARLGDDPKGQNTQRGQQTPDRGEISVVSRQRVQMHAVGRPAYQRDGSASAHVKSCHGHQAEGQNQCRILHSAACIY